MSFDLEGWKESLAQSFPSAYKFLKLRAKNSTEDLSGDSIGDSTKDSTENAAEDITGESLIIDRGLKKPLSFYSPFYSDPVELPFSALSNLQSLIKSLFQLKQQKSYQASLPPPPHPAIQEPLRQDSVLMGYDFHLSKLRPRLIEVNTNASGFLLNYSRAYFEGLIPSDEDPLRSLQSSFESEWRKFKEWQKFKQSKEENRAESRAGDRTGDRGSDRGWDREKNRGWGREKNREENRGENRRGVEELLSFLPPPKKTVLIDEKPFQQPMLLEFFMFKDFFQQMGWPSFEICDSSSLKTDDRGFLFTEKGEQVDFVYNRTTDFYFERHPHLLKAFRLASSAISPQPREYWLLADKCRLCDWSGSSTPELKERLKGQEFILPFSTPLNETNREEFWKNRKKYFFKIPRGYGGKQVYRGAGLTRKTFERMCASMGIVQEYIPPSKLEFKDGKPWKIDFRAYVYEDKIQQLCARAYRGQVTNFKEEGSGFAPVLLSP